MRILELPSFLDPGFFEHVAHVWKGKLAKDESEETVSLLSSGAKDFHKKKKKKKKNSEKNK